MIEQPNKIKHDEFAKQYPALKNLGHDYNHCKSVVFKLISEDVLESVPVVTKVSGPLLDIEHGDKVFLLDSHNRVLGKVEPALFVHTADPRQGECKAHGQTILEAIYEQGIEERVEFVAWVRYGYDIDGGVSSPAWRVTWYKPTAAPARLSDIVKGIVLAYQRDAKLAMAIA